MKWKIANSCLKPPEIKIHEDSHGNSHLVGGIPTSLKNGGVRQLDGYSIPNMMGKS